MRHSLRTLARAPGFAAIAIVTLALCIGANSAIFSVVNAILLKPYPWPGSDRLVFVHNAYPKIGPLSSGISIPDYLDHRAGVPSLAESALIAGFSANLADEGRPERVYGLNVTPSLWSLLQVSPLLGRTFTEAEAQPDAARTVVLRHDFWQTRFASSPAALGQTLRLNGEPHTIIGVMPPGFYFPSLRAQFWTPYTFTPVQRSDAQRFIQFSTMLARLKPDATLAQAQREIDAVHAAVRARLPEARTNHESSGYTSTIVGFLDFNVRDIRAMLWLLQAGVAAALLIGCANVANLLLARASARQRELAIRSALGASRARLVRQLLGESLVLWLAGGALGLLVAVWSLAAVNALGVGDLPRGFGVALDTRVFIFTLLSALATGLAFGALPAGSATRGHAADALKSAGPRATATRRQLRVRSTLVIAQLALSLMLVATAALLIQSFARLQAEPPGFNADHTLTASLVLPPAKYGTPEKRAAFAEQLTARLAALPGVTGAGLTNNIPFSGGNPQGGYTVEGHRPPPGQPGPHGMVRQVSPGYFKAMGIPLLRGRLLEPSDTLGRERVVVVDRLLADRYWPHADPLGKRITREGGATQALGTWTIVGVVAPVKHLKLDEPLAKETLYFPYAQASTNNLTLVVQGAALSPALTQAVRDAVLAVDPEQPLFDFKPMSARIDDSLQPRRAPMLLLSLFAALALLLSALGIYGVLAFSVGQRTSEFGVRLALGAERTDILGLVLRQGTRLVVLGLSLGLLGYLALSRFLAAHLFQITPTDPLTLVLAPAVLAATALLACLLPARRATQVDPMTALRAE